MSKENVKDYFEITETSAPTKKVLAKCKDCGVQLDLTKNPKTTSSMLNHQRAHHKRFLKGNQAKPQKTITSYVKYDRATNKRMHESVLNFIIRDLRPGTCVEGAGFRSLCNSLNPKYQPPCYKTVRKMLEERFVTLQTKV